MGEVELEERPPVYCTCRTAMRRKPNKINLNKKELLYETTKYIHVKSTTVYVPSSGLGLSYPLYQRVYPSPPEPKRGVAPWHTRLWVRGWGSPNSNDWRKGLALCLVCV
jgi:hypothetical protein